MQENVERQRRNHHHHRENSNWFTKENFDYAYGIADVAINLLMYFGVGIYGINLSLNHRMDLKNDAICPAKTIHTIIAVSSCLRFALGMLLFSRYCYFQNDYSHRIRTFDWESVLKSLCCVGFFFLDVIAFGLAVSAKCANFNADFNTGVFVVVVLGVLSELIPMLLHGVTVVVLFALKHSPRVFDGHVYLEQPQREMDEL